MYAVLRPRAPPHVPVTPPPPQFDAPPYLADRVELSHGAPQGSISGPYFYYSTERGRELKFHTLNSSATGNEH